MVSKFLLCSAIAAVAAAWGPTTTTTSSTHKTTSTSTSSSTHHSTSSSTHSSSSSSTHYPSTSTSTSTTTSATPTPTCVNYYALNQLARFDNIDIVGATVLAGIPINEYLDLLFNGFSLVQQTDPPGTGVNAQSPPNVAVFGVDNPATELQGTPALTVVYPDTTVSFFDFFSFFFGCTVADLNGADSVPQSCAVNVTGYDTNGNQVAQQQFDFTADGLMDNMVQADLNSAFRRLQSATFSVEPIGASIPTNLTLAALTDTFNYTVYSTGVVGD